jgi:ABC-type multidrug transport system fused ATPase/permease subunit
MNGDRVSAGDENMTNANRQTQSAASTSGSAAISAAASVLVLVGIVLQGAELGYGHISSGNFWLFSVLATNIWNILSLHMNISSLQEICRFWPLLLVGFGLAIMLAARGNRSQNLSDSRKEGTHGLQ